MADPATPHAIDLVEAAYDVEKSDADWLPDLLEAGAPILDHGLGIVATRFERPPHGAGADLVLRDVHHKSLPADMWARLEAARSVLSADAVRALTSAGHAGTWTELAQDYPKDCELFLDKLGYPDMLGLVASDPRGVGIHLSAPLPEATRLTSRSRLRWQMLGAHISAAHRLRSALSDSYERLRAEPTDLPHGAEAVLDAGAFRIVDSVGRAREPNASENLRRAARRVDKARGKLRRDDPRKALEMWKALICGRWSVVDWFDTDGRRFVLARPNPPRVYDPRGLSEQECQVVTYVLLGETNKLIAYRLGLSQGRVSGLLKSAMHKLGTKSRAQLVRKLRPLGVPTAAA